MSNKSRTPASSSSKADSFTGRSPASQLKRQFRESSILDFFKKSPATAVSSPVDSASRSSPISSQNSSKTVLAQCMGQSSSSNCDNTHSQQDNDIESKQGPSSRPESQSSSTAAAVAPSSLPIVPLLHPAVSNLMSQAAKGKRAASPIELSSSDEKRSVQSVHSGDSDSDVQLVSRPKLNGKAKAKASEPIILYTPSPEPQASTSAPAAAERQAPVASTSKLPSSPAKSQPSKSSPLKEAEVNAEITPERTSKSSSPIPSMKVNPASSPNVERKPTADGSPVKKQAKVDETPKSQLDVARETPAARRSPRLATPEPGKSTSKRASSSRQKIPLSETNSLHELIQPVPEAVHVSAREFSVEIDTSRHKRLRSSSPSKEAPPSIKRRLRSAIPRRATVEEEDQVIARFLSPKRVVLGSPSPVKQKTISPRDSAFEDVEMESPIASISASAPEPAPVPTPVPEPKKPTRLPGESAGDFARRLRAERLAAQAPAQSPAPDTEPNSNLPGQPQQAQSAATITQKEDDFAEDLELEDPAAVFLAATNAAKAKQAQEAKAAEEAAKQPAVVKRTAAQEKQFTKKVNSLLDEWNAGNLTGGSGKFSLKTLEKEARMREKKGIVSIEEANRMASKVEEEVAVVEDETQDASQSRKDLETARAAREKGDFERLVGANKKAAGLMKDVLDESGGSTSGPHSSMAERQFWSSRAGCIHQQAFVLPEVHEAQTPFLGRFYQLIRNGLQDHSTFSQQLTLSIGPWLSPDEVQHSLQLLFQLISAPATDPRFACQILPCFSSLAMLASEYLSTGSFQTAIEVKEVQAAFSKLGALADSVHLPSNAKGKSSSEVQEAGEISSSDREKRTLALCRLLFMLQCVGSKNLWRSSTDSTINAVVLLARLSVDPTSSNLVAVVESTLHSLVHAGDGLDTTAGISLIREMHLLCQGRDYQHRLHLVLAFPHQSTKDRNFRRWLAWSILLQTPTLDLQPDALSAPPPLEPIIDLIASKSEESPLYAGGGFDDFVFFHACALLQIILSDLHIDISRTKDLPGRPSGKATREMLRRVQHALQALDKTIHVNVKSGSPSRNKARNQLTRICHGISHQMSIADRNILSAQSRQAKPIAQDLSSWRRPSAEETAESQKANA